MGGKDESERVFISVFINYSPLLFFSVTFVYGMAGFLCIAAGGVLLGQGSWPLKST